MVGFKKDKDKSSIKKDIIRFFAVFFSGFIIAVFLVLYIVMRVVNSINGGSDTSSIIDTSSEVLSSSEESSSIESSSVDIYIEEKDIYTHLLSACKDYDDSVTTIINVNYDTSSLYITLRGNDDTLHILSGDLYSDIDNTLESLITSTDHFEVNAEVEAFDISSLSTVDVINTEAYKAVDDYKGYSYKGKINYYIDSLLDETGVSLIGYKDNQYISISNLVYISSTESLDDSTSYINVINDSNSIYYSFIDYLYHRDI